MMLLNILLRKSKYFIIHVAINREEMKNSRMEIVEIFETVKKQC